MAKPIIALVGRPNVGKSTLFNRLAGEPLAIVDDIPGTTRDRIFSSSQWNGREFDIVDTGGIDPSSTARGRREPLSIDSAEFVREIRAQAEVAIEEADLVLLLTDAIGRRHPCRSGSSRDFTQKPEDDRRQTLAADPPGGQQSRQR